MNRYLKPSKMPKRVRYFFEFQDLRLEALFLWDTFFGTCFVKGCPGVERVRILAFSIIFRSFSIDFITFYQLHLIFHHFKFSNYCSLFSSFYHCHRFLSFSSFSTIFIIINHFHHVLVFCLVSVGCLGFGLLGFLASWLLGFLASSIFGSAVSFFLYLCIFLIK